MIDSRKLQKELVRLGLPYNQAVIYSLLAVNAELRIQEIVKLSGTPRSTVYESLKGLAQLGLIEETVEEHYTKLKAYPLSALRHQLKDQLELTNQRLAKVDKLEQLVASPDNHAGQNLTVRYYKDRAGGRQLLWNTLHATDRIYVYSAWGRSAYVGKKFYETFVEESAKRHIQERVLINPYPAILDFIQKDLDSPTSRTKIADIRTLEKKHVPIHGETFIYDDIYAQIFLQDQKITGFEIESQQFVDMQRSMYETLWNAARPIDTSVSIDFLTMPNPYD